ncbi:MAG: hypothetical protein BWY95_01981 [Bacteroidetes bacterium ADurb.BinA104]|nr:MAG: hypothetical protein BWY95_01981 [Bacteroidetes bacterium ADurb.BinA104]
MEVESNGSGEPTDTEAEPPERLDLDLLVVGKKMGLSFDEMNMFRVRDLIKFVRIYTGNDEETEVRQANQADFDRW